MLGFALIASLALQTSGGELSYWFCAGRTKDGTTVISEIVSTRGEIYRKEKFYERIDKKGVTVSPWTLRCPSSFEPDNVTRLRNEIIEQARSGPGIITIRMK